MTEHAEHDHRKSYYMVFGLLILGTLLTVGAAQMDLGMIGNVSLGLAIAVTKASLVALLFMHLRDESKIFFFIAIFPLVLFLVLVFLLLPDVGLSYPSPLDDPSSPLYRGPAAPAHH